jgi:hypothetical protein
LKSEIARPEYAATNPQLTDIQNTTPAQVFLKVFSTAILKLLTSKQTRFLQELQAARAIEIGASSR